MYVLVDRPTLVRPYVECLDRPTWMVCEMGGKWPGSCCFIEYCFLDFFYICTSKWPFKRLNNSWLVLAGYFEIWSWKPIAKIFLKNSTCHFALLLFYYQLFWTRHRYIPNALSFRLRICQLYSQQKGKKSRPKKKCVLKCIWSPVKEIWEAYR